METSSTWLKKILLKPTANNIVNGEILDALSLRSETKQRCPIFPSQFNMILESLSSSIKQEK